MMLPRRFSKQPQYNAPTPGLLKAFIPTGNSAVSIGGATPLAGPDGVGFRATSSISYYQASPNRIISGLDQWAIVTAFRTVQATGSNGAALYCERAAAGGNILKLEGLGNSSPYLQMTIRDDTFSLLQFAGSSTITNDGKLHVAWGVRYAPNDHRLFIDGRQEASSTGTISGTFTEAAVESRIGADAGDASPLFTGPVYFVGLLKRAPSPAEIAHVGMNPWVLFKTPTRSLWGASSGTPPVSGLGFVKVSGSWKNLSGVYVKVAGTWKSGQFSPNVSGSWKTLA